MAFQVSPGVVVKEKDLTSIVPAVSSTIAGFAGHFEWGPVAQIVTVDSENNLFQLFGRPSDSNAEEWFSAAQFLGYGNNLKVVRVVDDATALNAGSSAGTLVNNDDLYQDTVATNGDNWIARYPGVRGNSLKVAWHDGGNGTTFSFKLGTTAGVGQAAGLTAFAIGATVAQGTISGATVSSATFLGNIVATGPAGFIKVNTISGTPVAGAMSAVKTADLTAAHLVGTGGASNLTGNRAVLATVESSFGVSAGNYKLWQYANKFPQQLPATTQFAEDRTGSKTVHDAMNLLVIDEDGEFTGTKGTILETYNGLSKASNAKKFDGDSNFYKDVINDASKYIWWGEHPVTVGNASTVNAAVTGGSLRWGAELPVSGGTFDILNADGVTNGFASSLVGGTGQFGGTVAASGTAGYGLFEDSETVDVSLLIGGNADSTLAGALVDLCDKRKDCVAFLSPEKDDCVANDTPRTEADCETNVLDFRENQLNKNSSYAVLDSGWKKMYDRYNDKFRWMPLNADTAGICVRSDEQTETWFSPAGLNRGQVRGAVKLAFNPRQAHRDNLYQQQVNPVVSFPGEGTVLFGDKTLQSKPSAFDRINVRRLFIVLEKAISTASKFQLFEQNDAFTRVNFKSLVEPFLRDVQARRGIFDFKVICDESNNPPVVVDRNEFVADIFIKPTRSINFITLNFIATKTGVDFTEIGA